jgi:ATP-binding cassette, subfamily B, bacterial
MKVKDNINYLRTDLLRVFLLLWNADKPTAFINMLLQLVQALLPVISLYFIKALIEAIVKGDKQLDSILILVIAFGLVQFFLALAAQYGSFINATHQETLTIYLANEVLTKAIAVDYEYYENPDYHDTLHLAQQQSAYKASQLLTNFNSLLLNSLSLLFLVAFFFSMHSLFALLFMVLSVPLAIIKWYSGFALLRMERKFAPMEREATYLHQTLTGVTAAKEVRVFGYGNNFIKKFNTIKQKIHHEKTRLHVKLTWFSLIAESAEIIAMTVIFCLLSKYALEKAITIGVFVIYIQGFQRLQSTSKNFLQSLVLLFQQRIFLKDLFRFFDIDVNLSSTGKQPFPSLEKGLNVSNVSFVYPQTTRPVLDNISLTCSPGKIIAIVGENGSGKSTLVKILARLYHLQSGQITINGNDLSEIAIADYRANTTFLFQDFEKYFLTIEENIAIGEDKNDIITDDVKKSAVLSGAHSFVEKLSEGYKTRMGRLFEGSEQISGGQWQKLALAKMFYKKTKLLILDEPTSALDPTSEFELFNNIKNNLGQKMVILITHRLYNLKIADHVYVMEDGRIAEEGSFESLVNSNGTFKKMYEAQKL